MLGEQHRTNTVLIILQLALNWKTKEACFRGRAVWQQMARCLHRLDICENGKMMHLRAIKKAELRVW